MEGLQLIDLFGVLSTRKYFRQFEVWGFKRILKVVRGCREVDQDLAESVICALEVLAKEERVLMIEQRGETCLFLTERGRNKEEDWE